MFNYRWRDIRFTMIVSVLAILAYAVPSLSQAMELDFMAVAAGQWWRMWTGHLTHYDGQHLFWDLLMFVVLGAACERNHRRGFAPAVISVVFVMSVAISLLCPEIVVYRGLSGLDTGLFVWFIGDQCRRCWREDDRFVAMMWLVPCVGLTAKLLFEATSGQTLFVNASNFTPLVETHLAGAALGFACCVTMRNVEDDGERLSKIKAFLDPSPNPRPERGSGMSAERCESARLTLRSVVRSRRGSLGSLTDVVLNFLTFTQFVVSHAFQVRAVEEHVLAAVRCNETKSFVGNAFDRAFCHLCFPILNKTSVPSL